MNGSAEQPPLLSPAPFHAGEHAVQERVGVRDKIASSGQRFIRGAMPQQHRQFFAQLPLVMIGSLDEARRPWASVLFGRPGFMRSPDGTSLHIGAHPRAGDPLAGQLRVGVPLGVLGLEAHTRRRNRMNGTVVASDATGFTLSVDQSFGNCPQYIQAREAHWLHDPRDVEAAPPQRLGGRLNDAARALIRRTDTLFIASASAHARGHAGAEGVDVSHRGGLPGFVRLQEHEGRCVLTLPDFRGNYMFNTLGNIAAHPRAGLLVIDHENGDVLQLSGRAEIVWDGAELQSFAGAQRLLKLRADEGRWWPQAAPLRWGVPEFAPQLAVTGRWPEVAA